MSAVDGEELLYNTLRFAFAGSLLLFLALMVRVMLREIDTATRDSVDARVATPNAAWLMMIDGASTQITAGQSLSLSRHATIGRSPDCEIVFDDPSVSSVHAAITQQGDEWIIEDYQSMNGTYLDGQPLLQASTLRDGDVLQFGRIRVRFMC